MSELTEVYEPEPFDPDADRSAWKGGAKKSPDEVQRAIQRHLLALGELVEQAGGGADLVLTDEFVQRLFLEAKAPVLQVWHDAQTATLRFRVHGTRSQTVPGEVVQE